jgi:hypothetical protein
VLEVRVLRFTPFDPNQPLLRLWTHAHPRSGRSLGRLGQSKEAAAAREGRAHLPRQRSEDAIPWASDRIDLTAPESHASQREGASVEEFDAQNAVDAEPMRLHLATRTGERYDLQRRTSIEPVFGTADAARGLQWFQRRLWERSHRLSRFGLAVHHLLEIIGCRLTVVTPATPPGRRPRGIRPHLGIDGSAA